MRAQTTLEVLENVFAMILLIYVARKIAKITTQFEGLKTELRFVHVQMIGIVLCTGICIM